VLAHVILVEADTPLQPVLGHQTHLCLDVFGKSTTRQIAARFRQSRTLPEETRTAGRTHKFLVNHAIRARAEPAAVRRICSASLRAIYIPASSSPLYSPHFNTASRGNALRRSPICPCLQLHMSGIARESGLDAAHGPRACGGALRIKCVSRIQNSGTTRLRSLLIS
jgi:hypothetical protein